MQYINHTSKKQQAVVFIGGSYGHRGAIVSVKKMGLIVILTDLNPNDHCKEYADIFIQASATDSKYIFNEINKLASTYDIVGAYGIADYAMETVGLIHEHFIQTLPGSDTYKKFTDKSITNELLMKEKVPCPKQYWSGTKNDYFDLKQINESGKSLGLVVKSTNLCNSESIHIIDNLSLGSITEVVELCLSKYSRVLIQEYISGEVISADAIIANERIYPISTTKHVQNSPSEHHIMSIQPGLSSCSLYSKAFKIVARIASILSYKDGPITVDFILNSANELFVLEASPHFHRINCEIIRGNGNPMAALMAYYKGDDNWCKYLEPDEPKVGVLYLKQANCEGVIERVDGEEWLKGCPVIHDYYFNFNYYNNDDDQINIVNQKTIVAFIWLVLEHEDDLNYWIDQIDNNLIIQTSKQDRV